MNEARSPALIVPRTAGRSNYPVAAAVIVPGAVLYWLCAAHPTLMPDWAPWDFSPTVYLGTVLAGFWYIRGIALAPAEARPAVWRRIAFALGLALIYAVLQTRFEYWSQHMFFLNRIQHDVMHHLGPFLIALSWPGAAIARGMPAPLRRVAGGGPVAGAIRIVQQPLLAGFLFVGLVYFWLIPAVHFRAMIDPTLYAVMNASMVIDGLLFWFLVLDPRPRPPARASFGVRAALSFGVMFPQIALGAFVALTHRDLYSYYDLCGRLFPSLGALSDQHIGGIVIWIPPAMMSVLGMGLVLNAYRLHEEIEERARESTALPFDSDPAPR
ncbi:MAG TPA: cytochrome c oxidase assembly protein [Stellaceae bacterium]|jgi:putative membrane protein